MMEAAGIGAAAGSAAASSGSLADAMPVVFLAMGTGFLLTRPQPGGPKWPRYVFAAAAYSAAAAAAALR